jgi:hypothetical protein
VDVVQQHDDRPAGRQPAEERQPVLDVDDEAGPVPQDVEERARVDPEPAAAPHDPHTADDLGGGGTVMGSAEQGHPEARGGHSLGHLVDIVLRAAALGMCGVPPAEEEDVDRR